MKLLIDTLRKLPIWYAIINKLQTCYTSKNLKHEKHTTYPSPRIFG